MGIGAIGIACFTQFAAASSNASWAGLWMTASLFFGRMQTAGFWVNMVDICPESAGNCMGLSNTLATIPGIIAQPITQSILEATDSWAVVFAVCGAVGVTSAFVFLLLADDVSLDTPAAPHKQDDNDDDEPVKFGRES